MTAPELLAELDRRGVRVRVVGDNLRLAPVEALDDGLLAEARRLKPELLELVCRGQKSAPAACGWCGAGLAPYLFASRGVAPTLCCPSCHRWTATGGAS